MCRLCECDLRICACVCHLFFQRLDYCTWEESLGHGISRCFERAVDGEQIALPELARNYHLSESSKSLSYLDCASVQFPRSIRSP